MRLDVVSSRGRRFERLLKLFVERRLNGVRRRVRRAGKIERIGRKTGFRFRRFLIFFRIFRDFFNARRFAGSIFVRFLRFVGCLIGGRLGAFVGDLIGGRFGAFVGGLIGGRFGFAERFFAIFFKNRVQFRVESAQRFF